MAALAGCLGGCMTSGPVTAAFVGSAADSLGSGEAPPGVAPAQRAAAVAGPIAPKPDRVSPSAVLMATVRDIASHLGWIDDAYAKSAVKQEDAVMAALLKALYFAVGMAPWAKSFLLKPDVAHIARRTHWLDGIYTTAEVDNIVLLGAGFDFRHARLAPRRKQAALFELDTPATQAAKLKVLASPRCAKLLAARAGGPPNVTYVPADFALPAELAGRLQRAGFDKAKPTLFLLEGQSMYLPPEALDALLAIVADSAPGSVLAATWLTQPADPSDPAHRKLAAYCEKLGEPLTFFLPRGSEGDAWIEARGLRCEERTPVASFAAPGLPPPSEQGITKDDVIGTCGLLTKLVPAIKAPVPPLGSVAPPPIAASPVAVEQVAAEPGPVAAPPADAEPAPTAATQEPAPPTAPPEMPVEPAAPPEAPAEPSQPVEAHPPDPPKTLA